MEAFATSLKFSLNETLLLQTLFMIESSSVASIS